MNMTPLMSLGDLVVWRKAVARIVRIAWGRIPCAAAPWWAAYHLSLDNGRIVPAWKLRPVEVTP